jgi:hypothetical protein
MLLFRSAELPSDSAELPSDSAELPSGSGVP